MIGVILAIAIAIGFAAWVLHPLLDPKRKIADRFDEGLEALLATKEAAYQSIIDLEFDHSMGKVSDQDYIFMRRQHEHEAIEILKQLDTSALATSAELIEREIAEARDRLRSRRR